MDLLEQNRTYHVKQNSMEFLPNYFKWTYGGFSSEMRGVVVELGCGAGLGIGCYVDQVDRVYAVDHNPDLLQRVKDRHPSDKVVAIAADLLDDWSELAAIKADAVIMMDVLEHFNDDAGFLVRAAGLLKAGGRMLIKVPGQSKLYSEIDRASGHFRRYDRPDIARLAEQAGLSVKFIKSINVAGALAYRFKRKKSSNFSGTFSKPELEWINRAMPLISLADTASFLPGLSYVACLVAPNSPTLECS